MSFEPLRRYAASLPGAARDAKAIPAPDARALIARPHALIAAKLTRKARDAALGASVAGPR